MFRSFVMFVVGLLLCAVSSHGAADVDYDQQVKPLLQKFCYDCHGEKKPKADLSLKGFKTEADVRKHREVWEKVLHNVRSREMPPSKKPQPSQAERDLIIAWIEGRVFQTDCSKPDPGRVTIRRLNRAEYNNTIRDLVGVDFQPGKDFPVDDTGYGFDNIGDVLSLPPVLFERYFAAANAILDQALVTYPNTNGPTVRLTPQGMKVACMVNAIRSAGYKMMQNGTLSTNMAFTGGDYVLRIRAWGDQAGDAPPKLRLELDGQVLGIYDVTAIDDRPQTIRQRLENVTPGMHELTLAYINNYRKPETGVPVEDRNLAIQAVEITGPSGPQVYPESHKRIFFVSPTSTADQLNCAGQIVERFAKRAYRRPVTSPEVERLLELYSAARKNGDNFEASVSVALQAILVSPHFLFRGEMQPEPDNPAVIFPVDEYSLASRLSYFLWSSMPDEELFALAGKNSLRTNFARQVKRMLNDPKAEAFGKNFVGQWLQVRNLEFMEPDPAEFPEFDDELRLAMQKETELLFGYIMKEDRSLLELLNANYTFVNDRLARHYNLPGVTGSEFKKVQLKDANRGGVLTHAGVLTLTSNPTRTSPVKRGKWVLENLLGTPPPPPPPDVPELPDAKHGPAQGTLRQRLEAHRSNPTCASCHERMDPIGFGLENFDAIGMWRKAEGKLPIDASGQLVSGEKFKGAAQLKEILVKGKKDEFVRCISEKMLTYALGRGLEVYDKCAVDQISKNVARHDCRFSSLVFEIVNSAPFQMRRGENRPE